MWWDAFLELAIEYFRLVGQGSRCLLVVVYGKSLECSSEIVVSKYLLKRC